MSQIIDMSNVEQAKNLEEDYEHVLEAKEDLFKDYQALEETLNDVRFKQTNLQKDYERLKKQKQVDTAKLEVKVMTECKRKDDFRNECKTLKAKLETYKVQVMRKEKEVMELKTRVIPLENDLKGRDMEIHKLEIIVKDYQTKYDTTLTELKKTQATVNVYLTKYDHLEHELQDCTKRYEDDEIRLKECDKEREELQTTINDLRRKYHSKEDAYDKLYSKYLDIQDSEKKNKSKVSRLDYEVEHHKDKLHQLEKDLTLERNKPTERQYDVIQVENVQTVEAGPPEDFTAFDSAELERSNFRIKELEELVHQHEVENSSVRAKLENYKGQVAKLECALDNAQRHRSVGSVELEGEKSRSNNLLADLKNLKDKLHESEKVIEQRKKEVVKRDKTISDLKERLAGDEVRFKDKEEEMFALEGKIAELEAKNDQLHDNLMEGRKKFGALETDLKLSEDNKDGVSGELMYHSRKIKDLEARAEDLESKRLLLEEQNQSYEQKIHQLEEDLSATNHERSSLERQINDVTHVHDKNRDEFNQSRKQMLEHKGTLDGVSKELEERIQFIKHLQRDIAKLNDDLHETRAELASAKSEVYARESELKKLADKNRINTAEIDRLEAEKERLRKDSESAEIQLVVEREKYKVHLEGCSNKRVSSARPSLELKFNSKAPENETQLSHLRQRVYTLERENENRKASENLLNNEISDKDDKIDYLQRQLDSMGISDDDSSRQVVELRKRCESLEIELEDHRSTNDSLNDELEDLRPKVNKLYTQVESLTTQKDTLRASFEETNTKLRITKDDLNASELRFMGEQKANSSLGKMLKKSEANNEEINHKLRAAESELEKLRRSLISSNATCDALTAYKKDLDRKLDEHKARIAQLESERGELKDQREAIEGDLGTMSYKLSHLNVKVKSIEKDKSSYQTDIEESQSKIKQLQKDLIQSRNLEKEKERMLEELTEDLREQENKSNTYKRQKKGLEDEVNTLSKELESQKVANEIKREKINELITQLESAPMQAPAQQIIVESAPPVMMNYSVESAPDDDRLGDMEVLYKSSQDRERALRQEVEDKSNRLRKIYTDKKKVDEHLLELQHQFTVLQRKNNDAEQCMNRLTRERDDCRKDLIDATNQRTLYETKAETEEAERRSLEKQLAEALRKRRETMDEILKTEENLIKQTLEARDLNFHHETSKEEKQRMTNLIMHLEEQVQNYRASLSVLRDANEKLKAEKESMQEANLSREKSINKFRVDNQKLVVERERFSDDLQNVRAENEKLKAEVEEANKRRFKVEDDIENLQNQLEDLKSVMSEGQRKFNKQQEKLNALSHELNEEQDTSDRLRETKRALEARIADLELKLATKSDFIPMQPVQFQQVQVVESAPVMDFGDSEELHELRQENMRCKQTIKEGEKEYRVLADKCRDLNSQLAEYEGNISRHETTSHLAHNRMKEAHQELDTLKRDAKPMIEKYESTIRDYELLQDEADDLRNKLSTTELQLDEETTKRKKLRKELDDMVSRMHEQDDEIVYLKKNVQELKLVMNSSNDSAAKENLLATLRNENDMQERQLQKLRKDVLDLHHESDRLQGKYDASEKNLFKSREDCADWVMKHDGLKVHNDALVDSLKACESKLYAQEEALHEAKKAKSSMKVDLDDANNKLKKSKAEVANYKKRISELQALIEELKQDLMYRDRSGAVSTGGSDEEIKRMKEKIAKYRDELQKSQEEVSRLQLQLREKDINMSSFDNSTGLLRAENDKLRSEVRSQQKQANEYKTNYQDVNRKMENIQVEWRKAIQENNHLVAQSEALEDVKERYRKSEMETEAEKSKLKSQIDALKHDKNRLTTELTVLKKKHSALTAQLSALQNQKSSSGKDNAKLKRLTELESLCEKTLREKEEKQKEVFVHQKNHARAANEILQHTRDRDGLEDKVNQLTKANAQLSKYLKDAQESHRTDKEEMLRLKKNVKTLEQELTTTKHQLDRMKNTNEIQEQQIAALNTEHDILSKKIEDLRNEDDDVDGPETDYNDHLDAQRKITELETLIKTIREKKVKAEKELATYKSKVWDLEDNVNSQTSKAARLEKVNVAISAMNDKLKQDLAEVKRNTWDAQQNYNTVVKEANEHRYDKEMLETEKDGHNEDIRRLRDELTDMRSQKEKVSVERNDVKFQLQRRQVELSQLTMELNETKEDNENLKLELMKATSDNEKLKEMAANQEVAPVQVAVVESVESEVPFDFDELDGAKREKEKLQIERHTLDNRLRDVEYELEEHQKDKHVIATNLSEANKKINSLETEMAILETARGKALHEREIAQRNFIDQRTENESLKQENETMGLQLKELRESENIYTKKMADYERQIAMIGRRPREITKVRKGKENTDLQKKIAMLEVRISTTEEKADEAEQERVDMENKNVYLREEVISCKAECEQLRGECSLLKESNRDLEAENRDLLHKLGLTAESDRYGDQQNTDLAAKINSLEREVRVLGGKVSDRNDEIVYLKKQLNTNSGQLDTNYLESHLIEIKDKSEIYRKADKAKAKVIEEMRDEKTALEIEVDNLKKDLEQAQITGSEGKSANETLRYEIETLREKKITQKSKLNEQSDRYELKIAELKNDNEIKENKMEHLEELIRKYEKQIQELREHQALPNEHVSTTMIFDVDILKRHQVPHSKYVTMAEPGITMTDRNKNKEKRKGLDDISAITVERKERNGQDRSQVSEDIVAPQDGQTAESSVMTFDDLDDSVETNPKQSTRIYTDTTSGPDSNSLRNGTSGYHHEDDDYHGGERDRKRGSYRDNSRDNEGDHRDQESRSYYRTDVSGDDKGKGYRDNDGDRRDQESRSYYRNDRDNEGKGYSRSSERSESPRSRERVTTKRGDKEQCNNQ